MADGIGEDGPVPEGDTIWRVAERLRPVLVGRRLVRFEAARLAGGPRPRPGEEVVDVTARGKHLLIRFERGVVLQTHLRMTGSWHVVGPGERWPKPAHLARAVVEVEGGWSAVCFSAPVVRTTSRRGLDAAVAGGAPGARPVPAGARPGRGRAPRPAQRPGHAGVRPAPRPAGGGRHRQRLQGEVLWACRVHPTTPLGVLDDEQLDALYRTAHRFLRANLRPGSAHDPRRRARRARRVRPPRAAPVSAAGSPSSPPASVRCPARRSGAPAASRRPRRIRASFRACCT